MITRFRTMTLLLIVVLALAACQAPAAAPAEPAAAPNAEAVVQALADALNAGDVDAAMALMSDNPSFTTDETITGVDAVRGLYAELVAGDFRIQPNVQSVEGDTIKSKTLTWGAGMPPAVEPLEADEVYIVQDGKISSISWTPTEESANKLAAFMTGMEAEATVQALADALNAGDVDAAVALIADNAIFDMADGEPLNGADQFRELFDYLVAGHFRIEATPKNTDGGTVTTDTKTWGDGIPGGGPNIATEVYVVEDGKITSISWTPTEETMANMETQVTGPMFTITFDGDQCAYDGPDTLPSGKRIKTVLDVTDQDAYENYGFAVVTLYGDKTMADLEAWPSTDQPPWTKLYSITFSDDVSPQSTRVEDDAWLVDGPVYLVCFTATDQDLFKSDVVGPIEVAAATAE